MQIALLVTNTDESAFAQAHPKDGEKFPAMMHLVRPDWGFAVFSVKDGHFPEDLRGFDGIMITGSPASVNDGLPWTDRLLDLIRAAERDRLPIFGACFGHQAVALALGGAVTRSPAGWVHGLTVNRILDRKPWMADLPDPLRLYASHVEIVAAPPEGAEILLRDTDTGNTGFAIGRHIYTTQHHPEMTAAFIAALTEELAGDMGDALAARARASLSEPSDMIPFAESVARFYEQAVSRPLPEGP